eukprot:TRINITY_DN45002_c0_g1_i2.p1 TRINITY_DN45002_c0_g1~~TRINITY_DN45002_c0_g1_i2.p1  ORF type:complete len:525 (+),score=121.12 TRINITY_DN45002_c0_g1_i2:66-1577(+)
MARVVALIDMDCFYVACERAIQPELKGVPMVVTQYNPLQGDGRPGETGVKSIPAEPGSARVVARGPEVFMPTACNGSIIAVSYEARERGVTRFMRAGEARQKCEELVVMQVPTAHGKSNMNLYRSFGAKVLAIISEICGEGAMTEKASVDEVYVDITAPARALLQERGPVAVAHDAAEAGTHVAGTAEGNKEAEMGQQKTGPLGRSAFRGGHSGQVQRSISDASYAWWNRTVPPAWSESDTWPQDEAALAAGAAIVARARAAVAERLGFTCSAGIAANKMLAKLCGGLHKPNQQTVLPPDAVAELLDPLPVDRLRGFGGKLGDLLKAGRPELGLAGFESAGALRRAGEAAVAKVLRGEWPHPEATAAQACRMAEGKDEHAVEERPLSKQVASSKAFSRHRGGPRAPVDSLEELEGWFRELVEDVAGRLEAEDELNGRTATQLVVGVRFEDSAAARSKRRTLRRQDAGAMLEDAMVLRDVSKRCPFDSWSPSGRQRVLASRWSA